jgi:hypothetical protein
MFPAIITNLNDPALIKLISAEINRLADYKIPIIPAQANNFITDGYASGENKACALKDFMDRKMSPWMLYACIGDKPNHDLTIPYFIPAQNLPEGLPDKTLLFKADSWSISQKRLEKKLYLSEFHTKIYDRSIELHIMETQDPNQVLPAITTRYFENNLSNTR